MCSYTLISVLPSLVHDPNCMSRRRTSLHVLTASLLGNAVSGCGSFCASGRPRRAFWSSTAAIWTAGCCPRLPESQKCMARRRHRLWVLTTAEVGNPISGFGSFRACGRPWRAFPSHFEPFRWPAEVLPGCLVGCGRPSETARGLVPYLLVTAWVPTGYGPGPWGLGRHSGSLSALGRRGVEKIDGTAVTLSRRKG